MGAAAQATHIIRVGSKEEVGDKYRVAGLIPGRERQGDLHTGTKTTRASSCKECKKSPLCRVVNKPLLTKNGKRSEKKPEPSITRGSFVRKRSPFCLMVFIALWDPPDREATSLYGEASGQIKTRSGERARAKQHELKL